MSEPRHSLGLSKSWQFWMPATLRKAVEPAVEGAEPGQVFLQGYASLESPDHGDEEVLQEGLDWSYWLQHGHFKWNHASPDRPSLPEEFVGVGTKAELQRKNGVAATYVEGKMFDTPMAKQVADLAQQLERSGRQIGLSVEGGIQVRQDRSGKVVRFDPVAKLWKDEQGQPAGEGKRIARAVVTDVTITPHPMHPEARASVGALKRSLLAALDAGYPAPAPPAERGAGASLLPQGITPQPRPKKRLAKDQGPATGAEQPSRPEVATASVRDRLDRYREERDPLDPELLDRVRQTNLGLLEGFTVWTVQGELLRDQVDIDWVIGGNPGRYAYVPNGELWIEATMTPTDQAPTLLHELVECDLMVQHGQTYDEAHDQANVHERAMRRAISTGEITVVTPVAAVADWRAAHESVAERAAARLSHEEACVRLLRRWPELSLAEASAIVTEIRAAAGGPQQRKTS